VRAGATGKLIMKICHITSVHPADDVRIFWKECRSLAQAGHQVHIVALRGPAGCRDGVQINVVKGWSKNRVLRASAGALAACKAAAALRADIYHLHDPELLLFVPYLRWRGAKVIYDMHELLPAQILTKSWIPRHLRGAVSRVVALIERPLLKRLPTVLASAIMSEPYRFIARSCLVLNAPRAEDFAPSVWPTRPETVGYLGVVSPRRGSSHAARAMASLNERGVRCSFLCIGPGSEEHLDELSRYLTEHEVNARVTGFMPAPAAYKLLADVRVGLVLLKDDAYYGLGAIPTKLLEYMYLEIPIVASRISTVSDIVEQAGCGILVDFEDVGAISDAIELLLRDSGRAREMGERGRRYAIERYAWANEERRLLEFYDGIPSAPSARASINTARAIASNT
jgi:glycosyltransferase involved in cell wall biosynthesis